MNIWLFNPYGPIPGEGWRAYRFTMLGKALAERGHDVTWWTANFSHHFKMFRSEGWEDRPVSKLFRIRFVPTTSYDKNMSFGRLAFEVLYSRSVFRRALESEPPDCIVGVDPPQIVGYMCVRLARRLGVPLVLDVFDQWPELFVLAFPRLLRPLAPAMLSPFYGLRKHNLRRAAAVTALCDTYMASAKAAAPGLDASQTLTVFNGIDVAAFRAALPDAREREALARERGKKPGEVWVVYAGTLGNNYDVPTVLRAAARLQECGDDGIRIWIAGEGPLRSSVTEFIRARGVINLKYIGKLSHEDLIRFYSICDIGLSPYVPESNVAMPDKAYDYMAAGLPIVNSLRGELEQLLRDRQIGIQYNAGDPESLAGALESLAADEGLRNHMARNSHDAAMDFDQNVQYGRYVDFIEETAEHYWRNPTMLHAKASEGSAPVSK